MSQEAHFPISFVLTFQLLEMLCAAHSSNEESQMNVHSPANKVATLHRMAIGNGFCPHGLKAKALLERQGFTVIDQTLTSRAQVEAFKTEHKVTTTPQVFIGTERVGGYDDLRRHLGLKVRDKTAKTYRPVLAVFGVAAAMAIAASTVTWGDPFQIRTVEWFIAFSMALLAMLKLQDVDRFATMFLTYDLLARRWVRYGYVYPIAEGVAGVLMVAGALTWFSAPLALVIGTIGGVSVFKAVWIDKRELKCACVGGGSNVPLGFLSFTENVMMVGMAIWMLVK